MKRGDTAKVVSIVDRSAVGEAGREAGDLGEEIGFGEVGTEELRLLARELAANLVNHANGGRLVLRRLDDDGRAGIEVESEDDGPGIPDIETALTDGFSTGGSLGYGLGTADRLSDELSIVSPLDHGRGTRVTCRKWLAQPPGPQARPPVDFGAATRPHPGMNVNGDAFVVSTSEKGTLVGVIDGLGHGQFAHRASRSARTYVESHPGRPLPDLFRGVSRSCRVTRGAVMALARIDSIGGKFLHGSIGNIETRLFGSKEKARFVIRRGVLGMRSPALVVTEHGWGEESILVLHSDGLTAQWKQGDFGTLWQEPATVVAGQLLRKLGRDRDDATVVVAKGAPLS